MDGSRILYVRGIGGTISKEELTIYFQSPKQSGGGDISSIDLNGDEAVITFEDDHVAKNVGSRVHTINGTRVDVSFHPSTRETQSQETSADQTWVIIRGLSQNTTEDALLNYFENTRRSGGGPVEEVNIKGDWARIKFESSEVAKCVVEREKHTLNDTTLDVSFEMPNRKDENTKTIEVAGLPRTTTKDSILNYFENKRRSGGGEVETVDLRLEAGVAFVTFKDIGVAKNVGSRKHIINGTRVDVSFHPSTRETQSQETSADKTWVIIRGLSQNTTEDALLNYFENTRRSGGGPVEEVNIKGVCARIKFESAEVAKCVVEREKHTLNDATLDVSFEMCDRRDENTKTIEVTGFPGSTTKDSILNYFENKRRSGGGEVENVNLKHEAGVAFVTFKDIGVVNTVLQKDKHVLDGATLKVTASNNTRCSSDREETQESRVIEVRGLAATSTKDSISMFFENTRRSGGGEVEHVDYTPEQGIAVVTFVKAESAVGVVNKGALTLDDAELKITIRKPVKELPIDTKRLLVKGLSDKTTRDGLQSYMEVVSRVEVLSIEFGEQGSAAVIFGKTYDYQTITQRVAKRQLEGQQLSIEQVPVCNCVLVTGLNRENTTEDAVLYHFENSKNGGGDVTKVELNIKEGWALVHFEDPEVVTKVLSKSHTLNEAKLEVSLHSPFLGKPLSQPGTQEGELVASIPVDSQLMLFICERHEADFKKIQDDHGITITWEEGAGSIMVKPSDKTSSDRKKFEEACEVIASFVQEFQTATSRVLPEAWEAVLDIFLENASAMEEKVLVHCVAQQHVISLTGKKQDVEGLRNDLQELKTRIERKVKLEASIETKSIDIDNTVRLQFLRDLDFGKELEAAYEVTQVSILLETGKVQIRAPPNTFHKVSAMIWETIAKVTEISLEMSQKAVEILRSTACRAFINDTFTANNLQASLAFDSARKDSVIVMGMNTEATEKASILIKRLVVEECVDLDEDQVQLEKSEKWSQLRYDLTEKRILSLSFDRRNKKMWLVGTKDDVSFALAAVTRFLKENTIVSNVVKLPTGCRRFLAKYREQELRQIEEDLKEHSTRIKRVTDEEDEDLVISGTTDGVEKGTKLVQDLAAKVRNEKFFLNKPGMRKVLGQSKGKKMLTLLENENKCVIEHYISEKYESHSKKSGEEKEENKKELCSYLTPEGKNILVFKDNICDRNVDVIVNAANSTLHHVGGVSKAIVEAAGKDVKDECDQYIVDHGPLLDGHVVTTSAGKLPFMKVIHAVGPKWTKEAAREKRMGRSPRQENLLSYAVKNALDSAQSYKSIALPAISTGVYDFPYQLCAKIMVDTAVVFFQENPGCRLSEIQFTSTDDDVVKAFVKEMDSRFLHDPNYESSSDTKVKGKARKVKGRKKTIPSTPSTASPADIPNAIKTPEDLKLILVTGNMSQEKVDVIVNSASSDLDLSKNASAKALSNAAGPTLQQECKAIGKVNIGDIVITSGGNLNCKHVFHTSCATWNQQSGEQELRAIIKKCLNEAQKRSLVSIAIPALGTGNLGYPRDRVAAASFDEVLAFSKNNPGSTLREVHLVVYDKDTPSVKAFREELQTRKGSQPGMPPSAATGSEKKKRGRAHGVIIKSSDPDDLDASNDAFEMVDEELDHTKPEIAMGAITVQAETGDITKEDTDAIAILSNNQLSVGGGVGIAILNAGGPTIQQECSSLGFQSSGSVAVTGAGKLNVKNIYHMVPDTMHSMRSIKDCIVNCLRKADSSGLTSLSFPAIGTGNIGKDVKEAAEGMLLAISKFAQEQPKSISFIRIVIYEPPMLKVFRSAMEACIRSSVEGDPGVISKIAGWLGLGKSSSATSYAIASKKMLSTKGDSYLEIFAGSKQHIDKVIKDIERDVADHFKQKVIVHDAIGKLSKQQTRKIRDLQAEHDVLVTIEEAIGRISIRGDVEGVLDVATTIHEILNQQMEEDYTRGVEELLAKNIQWYFRDDDGSWEPYDTSINLQIENAFNDGQDTVMVLIDDVRCEIVFKDMKETSSEDGEERVVVRKEFGKGIPLPNEWEVHPKDSSGKEEEVLLVPLDPVTHAIEYKKIADEVAKTSPVTITKIQRVQNPTQYRVYMVRKDQMEQKKGSNEQALFHGTAESSCASINKTGFNRSYCGKNAVVYGNGVYFARDASYSTQTKYSPPDAAGNRHMYLARVLVGEYTTGRQGMITPPPKGSDATDTYDTVVDNPGNPTIFVVFYDNQCYPDYLITFK